MTILIKLLSTDFSVKTGLAKMNHTALKGLTGFNFSLSLSLSL